MIRLLDQMRSSKIRTKREPPEALPLIRRDESRVDYRSNNVQFCVLPAGLVSEALRCQRCRLPSRLADFNGYPFATRWLLGKSVLKAVPV